VTRTSSGRAASGGALAPELPRATRSTPKLDYLRGQIVVFDPLDFFFFFNNRLQPVAAEICLHKMISAGRSLLFLQKSDISRFMSIFFCSLQPAEVRFFYQSRHQPAEVRFFCGTVLSHKIAINCLIIF